MIANKRFDLIDIIGRDFLQHGKLPIILLLSVLISAMLLIRTTHQTRSLTAKREQILLEQETLEIEWRNLILEKNVLEDPSRIERIATEKLQMQHVDPSQENVVIQ